VLLLGVIIEVRLGERNHSLVKGNHSLVKGNHSLVKGNHYLVFVGVWMTLYRICILH
jgi:hypothetical protein